MRLFLTASLAFFCFQIFAQLPDSLQVAVADSVSPIPPNGGLVLEDSNNLQEKRKPSVWRVFSKKKYPNPRTAAFLSLALPGAGQAYNKKWWKIPVVWGALGGVGYFTFDTQKTYHDLRDSYKLLVDGNPETNPTKSPYNTFDAQTTKGYRDQFRGYTEKWYLALGVTYLLAVTDAFVDAQLARFDVSDDLSFRLKPSLEAASGLPAFGLGVSFSIGHSPSKPRHHAITPSLIRP